MLTTKHYSDWKLYFKIKIPDFILEKFNEIKSATMRVYCKVDYALTGYKR